MVAGKEDIHRTNAWLLVLVAVRMRREMDSMVDNIMCEGGVWGSL